MSEKIQELITLEPIEFKVTTESARQDVQTYGEIPEFDPSLGKTDPVNAQIIIGSKHFNKQISAVEKLRKHFKEPSLTYGRAVDATAKEITAIYEPAKLAWNTARKRIDDFEKIQLQKKIDAELARQTKIANMVSDLRMVPGNAIGMDRERLTRLYETVEIPQEPIFEERFDEAMEIYKDTVNKLETMIETAQYAEKAEALAKEAEAKRQAEQKIIDDKAQAEREEFLREKAEFQKEKDALKAEQDAKDEAEAMRKAEQEAKELAEQQEAEAKALQEEQEKAEAKHKAEVHQRNEQDSEECLADMNEYIKSMPKSKELLKAVLDGSIRHINFGDIL